MDDSPCLARCLMPPYSSGGTTKDAGLVKTERVAAKPLALQATVCIEQYVQTKHRVEFWRVIRNGSDLGGPLARRANYFRRQLPNHVLTASFESGVYLRSRTGSRVSGRGITVFQTDYGAFDGGSWERLCQLVFKRKFTDDGYTHIPATPGDYGLEGFTKTTGCGFQCYCPDKVYPPRELYEKQRDKITTDLKKLQIYEADLTKVLGTTKLRRWHLVTPSIAHNDLIKHAQAKETECLR